MTAVPLYPLRFLPIYQRYIWGGQRLKTFLGRQLDEEGHYAESWEICDYCQFQSVVESGPLAGTTLHELMQHRADELFGGDHALQAGDVQGRFPLLLKYLDAEKRLSLQVHPDDEMAAQLTPPDSGKSEAWVVLDTSPHSVIYAGLRPGVDRRQLSESIAQGTSIDCLHRFHPEVGDCVFLPAGTPHSLGEGVLVAEIQETSNATFRLFDWNRLGSDGKPRPLHVAQALEAINYNRGPISPIKCSSTSESDVCHLVACDKFLLDRWELSSASAIGGGDRLHIVMVLDGSISIEGDPATKPLCRGDTVLLPAALGSVQLVPKERAIFLDVSLPPV